ncbi:MAG: glutathione synthase, partial [Thiobacillaceae bacterium]|nr:glutathione synthase [Thiobacillaceae bacterium]
MKLLFVADPLETFKIHKDSTYAMMLEAAGRGHETWAMVSEDLAWNHGRVTGRCQSIGLTGSDPWFMRGDDAWRDLADFDAVLMRRDPPFDQAYLYATWLLDMAERQGARVFNRP